MTHPHTIDNAFPAQPVPVQIVNYPQEPPKPAKAVERPFTMNTVNVPAGGTAQILNHAPMRKRATVTIVGQSSDVVYICGSSADAQKNTGAIAMGLQVLDLRGTGEVWVASATAVAIGVVVEYESH